ncbi:methyltransferase family protein [Aporhodopirellula aestuarii]|uniref:Isoprenylcysteine carboxylmethyltransferase family protein n=1 Tax=Aporhodopirellula aestuarii TaxID=2950107 RepID=A0ABT0U0V5_9BACT|nr:isoprenylcysteine carboxylmethyltransferase family protein [Aporhodopirellula aestuarii]MCM2370269.1 isoprenylcysteine carboxylmethyltransferase family protein [Aporhodopirellula aestuarii]
MNAKTIVSGYLIAQAASVAVWWGVLVLVPSSVEWFQPEGWPPESLLGFWLGDVVLLVGGSFVTANAVWKQTRWATTAVWSLAMAILYPTLYCIGVSVLTDEGWIASAMMASMAGLTLAMATIHGNGDQAPSTIRVTPMNRTVAVAWTFAQTFVFWSVFLWILPMGIVEAEERLGIEGFRHPGQTPLAMFLLVVASGLGLWSGIRMATLGLGTPLPTATAPRLVVGGPYRYVRNPMALAGIMQGLAVGWYLGSYVVIGYAFGGAVVWQFFVRPVEEGDLQERFGDWYRQYQRDVWLWIPTFKRTQAHPNEDLDALTE